MLTFAAPEQFAHTRFFFVGHTNAVIDHRDLEFTAHVFGAHHDFAAISLSDLLTPWETIEKRLAELGSELDSPTHALDAASFHDVTSLAREVKKEFGRIDGLIANAGRRDNLARARELLNVPADTHDAASADDAMADPGQPTYVCPDCGAPMIIIETFVRGQPIRAPPRLRGAA